MSPGPTWTDLTHTVELVERHEVTVPVPVEGFAVDPQAYDEAVALCKASMRDWCRLQGLEPGDVMVLEVPGRREAVIGVSWVVVVGRGSSDTSGVSYPEVESGIGWVWSDRWQHWRGWFASMALAAEARARAAGGDNVIEFPRPSDPTDREGLLARGTWADPPLTIGDIDNIVMSGYADDDEVSVTVFRTPVPGESGDDTH